MDMCSDPGTKPTTCNCLGYEHTRTKQELAVVRDQLAKAQAALKEAEAERDWARAQVDELHRLGGLR